MTKHSSRTRRQFLGEMALIGAAAASGCAHEKGTASPTPEELKQIAETGVSITLRSDPLNDEKNIVQVRLLDNAKGRAVEQIAFDPFGVAITCISTNPEQSWG